MNNTYTIKRAFVAAISTACLSITMHPAAALDGHAPTKDATPGIGALPVAKPRAAELTARPSAFVTAAEKHAAEQWRKAAAMAKDALTQQRTANSASVSAAATTTGTPVAGDYSATPLAPSGSWSAGGNSGSFDWSYPLAVPSTAAGPTPTLAIAYDSGSVDGRLPSTNNQATSLGEGFDISSSYIERTYSTCDDDGRAGKFDRCWAGDQVTMVINGKSDKLVKVSSTSYRLQHDDASTVDLMNGQAANGDNDGEHWRLTTSDGTTYDFGLDKLPGAGPDAPRTNSVWTVPVFGDDPGEPCHQDDTFADNDCRQAWRWNLDLVTDTHGNASTYWYKAEHNNYAKNGNTANGVDYIRGGWLDHVDYGLRVGNLFDNDANNVPNNVVRGPQRVAFDMDERCLQPGTGCDQLTKDNQHNWPDVPFDSICNDGDTCTGDLAPTFFTRKLLSAVTTSVLVGGTYQPVDSWQFAHEFVDANEVQGTDDQSLWLSSITHTAKAVNPAITLTPVKFTPVMLDNRVDGGSDDILPLGRPRLATITSETGRITTITYSDPQCSAPGGTTATGNLPASEDENTMRCFPQYWSPNGETPREDWFQKYVVTRVDDADPSGGAPNLVTQYQYGGGGAWHFAAQPMTPKREQTWSEWRGYSRVTTLVGNPNSEPVLSKTVDIYMRGMDGDPLAGGGTRSASITGVQSDSLTDKDQYAGYHREHVVYNGYTVAADTTGPEVSGEIYDPWSLSKASQTFPSQTVGGTTYPAVTIKSWMLSTAKNTTRTRITSGATPTQSLLVSATSYDDYGMPSAIDSYDIPDVNASSTHKDPSCTRIWYARNPSAGLTSLVARKQVVAVSCAATPALPSSSATAADVISDTATLFDGATVTGPSAWNNQTPTVGEQRIAIRASAYASGAPSAWQTTSTSSFDSLGRVRSVADAKGATVTTTYNPSGAGVLISTTVTNPLGHTITTQFEPLRALATAVTDTNGKTTETQYDALGRRTAVWTPATPRALNAPPAHTFAYHDGHPRSDGTVDETWVASSELVGNTDTYRTTYDFYDALLRPLQEQKESALPGRVISENTFNSRGLIVEQYDDLYDPNSEPASTRVGVVYGRSPKQTETAYDGVGRPVTSKLLVGGVLRLETDTDYTGDSTGTTAPRGGQGTRQFRDPLGRTTENREYAGPSPTGSTYLSTKFAYAKTGQLLTLAANDGSTYVHVYDLFNRETQTTDPDAGTTTKTYNTLDQLDSQTDARGIVHLYDYDALGRKTAAYVTSRSAANQRATWTYDTVSGAVGHLASSTSYQGGLAYTKKINSYDSMYRVTGTSLVLPSGDALVSGGAVPATITDTASYYRDGDLKQQALPALAGLPAETVSATYGRANTPSTLSGSTQYVLSTVYDASGEPNQVTLGTSPTSQNQAYLGYTYEAGTHRLLEKTITDSHNPWMSEDLKLAYDDGGNVVAETDPTTLGGASKADYQCFTYTAYGQLAEAWTPTTANCQAAPSAAALGGAAPYWTSYQYNSASMRSKLTQHTVGSGTLTTTAYTYGAAACTGGQVRPHSLTRASTTIPAGSTVTSSFACTADGSTSSRPGTQAQQSLTWDSENRMSRITEPAAGSKAAKDTTYIYDADGGLLIRRPTNNGAGETVLYAANTEVHSVKSTSTATPVVSGVRGYTIGETTVAMRTGTKGTTGSQLKWIFSDQHSSATVALDATTLSPTKRYFGPFGEARGPAVTWVNDHAFLDKSLDANTGLTHIGAREYDSATGLFQSVDPVLSASDARSLNGFSYADNNPATLSDPSGQMLPAGEGAPPSSPAPSAPVPVSASPQAVSTPVVSGYNFWSAWSGRHDTAVQLRAGRLGLVSLLTPGSRITTRMSDNFIPGGSSKGNGNPGYADLILWTETTVYVWEMKHAGGAAQEAGPEQLNRYVTHLQAQLDAEGRHLQVEPGFAFGEPDSGPNMSDPTERIEVFDGTQPGIQLYRWSRQQPTPAPTAQQENNEDGDENSDSHDNGDDKEDFPMQDELKYEWKGITAGFKTIGAVALIGGGITVDVAGAGEEVASVGTGTPLIAVQEAAGAAMIDKGLELAGTLW